MQKYEILAQQLRERIEKGDFSSNGKLPTEKQLMSECDVSRNTVRSALRILLNHGCVYARQGSGVYVRASNDKTDVLPIIGKPGQIGKNLKAKDSASVLISLQEIQADEYLVARMQCKEGCPIYAVERVRMIDGKKFAYEKSWYLKETVRYLNREICEHSIYQYLQEDMKLAIGFTDKYITAEKLTGEEAYYLGLHEGDPGLIICDHVYTDNGKLFNVSRMTYNYCYTKLYAAIVAE